MLSEAEQKPKLIPLEEARSMLEEEDFLSSVGTNREDCAPLLRVLEDEVDIDGESTFPREVGTIPIIKEFSGSFVSADALMAIIEPAILARLRARMRCTGKK